MVCFWQVHFLGWGDRWDQVFQRTSEDLQKLHTFTSHWRQVSNRSEAEFKRTTFFFHAWIPFSARLLCFLFVFFSLLRLVHLAPEDGYPLYSVNRPPCDWTYQID